MIGRAARIASLPFVLGLLLLPACDHESHLDPQSAYNVGDVSRSTGVEDDFWQVERHEEATRPRLRHPRSISLGEVGDAPLANSVRNP